MVVGGRWLIAGDEGGGGWVWVGGKGGSVIGSVRI